MAQEQKQQTVSPAAPAQQPSLPMANEKPGTGNDLRKQQIESVPAVPESRVIVGKFSAVEEALHRHAQTVKFVDDFNEGELRDSYDLPPDLPKVWNDVEVVVFRMRPESWNSHQLRNHLLPVTADQFARPVGPMNRAAFDSQGFLRAGDVITFLCPKKVVEKFHEMQLSDIVLRNEAINKGQGDPKAGGLVMRPAEHSIVHN